ncbi:MAG: hypothetical protein AAF492_27905, partial [Verrucomicrobiota bacterium]
ETVLDVHTPMNAYLAEQRKSKPDFAMSGDGVHFNRDGHRIVANAILKTWGFGDNAAAVDPAQFKNVHQAQTVLHHAWLSHVGHKRPGVKKGLPLEEAQKKATEILKK